MKRSFQQLLQFFVILSACFFWMTASSHAIEAGSLAETKLVMKKFQGLTTALGAPRAENGVLYFGATRMNDRVDEVDICKNDHMASATLFVKTGNDFIRVTTSLKKDGKRVVGTKLREDSLGFMAIRNGTSFYGETTISDVSDENYFAGFEPIKSASGEIIGAWFLGFSRR